MGRQSEIGARLRQARLQSTPKITQKDLSARLETMEVYLDPTMLSNRKRQKKSIHRRGNQDRTGAEGGCAMAVGPH